MCFNVGWARSENNLVQVMPEEKPLRIDLPMAGTTSGPGNQVVSLSLVFTLTKAVPGPPSGEEEMLLPDPRQ